MVPADRSELTGVQAGAADEGAVNVLSTHDRRDIVALDGPAVQNTHTGPGFAAHRARNVLSDSGRYLLRVSGGGDLAGADRPDRLVGDHHRRDRLGGDPCQGPPQLRDDILALRD